MSEVKKFASLISFLSSVVGSEFLPSEIDVIYEKIFNFKNEEVKSNFVNLNLLFSAMSKGRKIEAIKEYKFLTGVSLKDAKDAVESVMKIKLKNEVWLC